MQKATLKNILKIVREFLDILSREIKINEAYLFGSYVKGTWLKHSDIDLVIVSNDFEGMKYIDRLELAYKIQWSNNIKPFIEVIPLTPKEFTEKINTSTVLRDAKKYWIKII